MRTGLMIVIALTVALLVVAPMVAVPEIEADLAARSAAALQDQGNPWASVSAQGRTITVGGAAPDVPARDAALAAVSAVRGVGDVVDATTSLPPPAADYAITLTRTASGVSLGGNAPDRGAIDILLAAIQGVDASATVDEGIAVESGTPVEGWQDLSALVVEQGSRLLAGQASISMDGIVIEGSVGSDAELAAIEDGLADVTALPVRIEVAVEQPRTYALALTRDANGLVLAGEVPDAATRDALIALAERQSVPAVESALLTIMPGVAVPDWDSMARALVRHVGSMHEGHAELAPGRLTVAGVVVDPAMAAMMQTALTTIFGADDDMVVSIDIRTLDPPQSQGTRPPDVTDLMAYAEETPIPEMSEDERLDAGACQGVLNALTSDARIGFLADGATLDPASLTLLEAIARTLRGCPETNTEVSGHTDSTGDPAADEALSQRRAEAVVDYLVLRGVNRERLVAAGYGDQLPVADNATEAGRVRNRRIEFLVELIP